MSERDNQDVTRPAVTSSACGSGCSGISTATASASNSTTSAISGNHASAARSSTATSPADSTPRLFECIAMPAMTGITRATRSATCDSREYPRARNRSTGSAA